MGTCSFITVIWFSPENLTNHLWCHLSSPRSNFSNCPRKDFNGCFYWLMIKSRSCLYFGCYVPSVFFKNFSLIYIFLELLKLILERGRGRERNINMKEKHWLVASHTDPDQRGNCNLSMCLYQESNPRPFGFWDDTPTDWSTPARARTVVS